MSKRFLRQNDNGLVQIIISGQMYNENNWTYTLVVPIRHSWYLYCHIPTISFILDKWFKSSLQKEKCPTLCCSILSNIRVCRFSLLYIIFNWIFLDYWFMISGSDLFNCHSIQIQYKTYRLMGEKNIFHVTNVKYEIETKNWISHKMFTVKWKCSKIKKGPNGKKNKKSKIGKQTTIMRLIKIIIIIKVSALM